MRFEEFVDIGKLQALCESFTRFTQAATAIIDLEGNVLVSAGWQEICTSFHRINPATARRCLESDTVLASRLKRGDRYNIYRCRNGLVDVAVPIHIAGQHVANFFTGQFFMESPDREYFLRQADEYGFDRGAYLKALDSVKIYGEDQIRSMMDFLTCLAQFIGETGLAGKRLEDAVAELQVHRGRLEERIAERTADLSEANREMQQEITERKRAEKALRESEEKFRALADASLAGILVYQGEDTVYVNPAMAEIEGYPVDERCRMKFWEPVHPAFRESVRRRGVKRQEGRPVPSKNELKIVRKSGEERWVVASSGTFTFGGKPAVVLVVQDITELKQAEEALRRSEASLTMAQEIAHLGSWNWDLASNTMAWSDEMFRIFGIRPGEAVPSIDMVIDATCQEDREVICNILSDAFDSLKPPSFEHRIVRPDGAVRWIRADGQFLFDELGRPVRFFGTAQDVTDQKKAESELEAAKARAELYLDLMGHDIRNYNQIATGFLELALGDLCRDEGCRELLSRPMEAINCSSRLISNVVKLQKIDGGKALENRPIDLCDVIGRIVAGYSEAPGRQITINFRPVPGCFIMANDLIDDVFSNLIGNAIKHTDPDRPLVIDIRVEGQTAWGREYLNVSLEDNGPGIPDELKGKLFRRLEPGKSRSSGRGLGLYLVRTLVEDFGGTVRIEDRVIGDYRRGARFVVMLPAAEGGSAGPGQA